MFKLGCMYEIKQAIKLLTQLRNFLCNIPFIELWAARKCWKEIVATGYICLRPC
uniref:Uncharacterized protein n=1 Tax=Setaria italica TaxID=4555 RepID=K4API9_SETIT